MSHLDTAAAIRRTFRAARLAIALAGAAVLLSTYAVIEGAIVAQGTIVVEGNVKKIQHASGGIVGEIAVAEGGRVAAGDLLIRLDETLLRSSLDAISGTLIAERARLARLEALRDGKGTPAFPTDLSANASLRPVLEGEARLAEVLLASQQQQERALSQQIEQSRQEILGLEEQRKSLARQREVVANDLGDLQPLYERGNIQRPRISALQRELMRIEGSLGDTVAKIGQANARIAETELQIARSDHEFIAGTVRQLREAHTRIGELAERRIAAEDQLRRVEIRSPVAGIVHQLGVHTVGGVVAPNDVLMLIVPSANRLVVEMRVRPDDIDRLSIGQGARVRIPALDPHRAGDLEGLLTRIGADLTFDPQARVSFYSATVQISDGGRPEWDGHGLIPGMPVEVFVKTGERTLASYMLKPVREQMNRAFREK